MTTEKDGTHTGDRETIRVGDDELVFRVTSDQSGGAVLAYEARLRPGGGPPVLHRHAGHELCRVDSGEMTLYVEDEQGRLRREVAGPGATVQIPGGREHTIRNESADEAVAFVVFTPGAEMERFVRAAASAREMRDVLRLASEHGIEMTRPLEEVA